MVSAWIGVVGRDSLFSEGVKAGGRRSERKRFAIWSQPASNMVMAPLQTFSMRLFALLRKFFLHYSYLLLVIIIHILVNNSHVVQKVSG